MTSDRKILIVGAGLGGVTAALAMQQAGLDVTLVEQSAELGDVGAGITLGPNATVVHLGDADKGKEHYEPHREYWAARKTRLAFAPVWLFLTEPGKHVLDEYVDAQHAIGIHVDHRVPDDYEDRPERFQAIDLFAQPGEIRIYD